MSVLTADHERRKKCRTKAQYRKWLLEYEEGQKIQEKIRILQHAIHWSTRVATGSAEEDKDITNEHILRELKWETQILADLEAELEQTLARPDNST